jgi:hypothetical protein
MLARNNGNEELEVRHEVRYSGIPNNRNIRNIREIQDVASWARSEDEHGEIV